MTMVNNYRFMLWYIQTVINLAAIINAIKIIKYIIQLETITRIIRTLIETMNYRMDVSCISGLNELNILMVKSTIIAMQLCDIILIYDYDKNVIKVEILKWIKVNSTMT